MIEEHLKKLYVAKKILAQKSSLVAEDMNYKLIQHHNKLYTVIEDERFKTKIIIFFNIKKMK